MRVTDHLIKGQVGESLACNFLIKKNFTILELNWRSGRYEIDIIAVKNNIIHFVEVKTRHSMKFGYPEQSVSLQKFKHMQSAAAAFLARFRETRQIQFDIVSILIERNKSVEYFFIEDVFLT